ncbi:hypothetical protein [Vagococcus sp. CY52-2]|uniref:hypothetical protein n=1 Tax=Vagococcus sp. CY52-2 TaxID=2925838 RepID=UPI001F59C15C|nr:hypothetical protein [Vagococcus sp. CY52-2]MCI0131034.1 hypothetical protein [Vagococcus sp. CY53-2]UNM89392.1 hypothetical protein MN187_08925 [Vagococcus sp. CY52-2]
MYWRWVLSLEKNKFIVEETQGIEHLLGQPIDLDWEHENYKGVPQSTIKKFVAMIHT